MKGHHMKLAFGMVSLSLVVALSGACKKKDEKPADKAGEVKPGEPAGAVKTTEPTAATTPPATGGSMSMSVDEACDKSISMMNSMADIVVANKGNCDGMGTGFEKWAADNKAFMDWAKTQDKDPAKKKEFEEKCAAKMKPVMEKLGPAMEGASACATNEKVKAALSSM